MEPALQDTGSGYTPLAQGFNQSPQTAARQARVPAACARPLHGVMQDTKFLLAVARSPKNSAFPFHKTDLNPSSRV